MIVGLVFAIFLLFGVPGEDSLDDTKSAKVLESDLQLFNGLISCDVVCSDTELALLLHRAFWQGEIEKKGTAIREKKSKVAIDSPWPRMRTLIFFTPVVARTMADSFPVKEKERVSTGQQ